METSGEIFEYYRKEVRNALKDNDNRYWHSVSVAITAASLSSVYDVDQDKCLIAGLLHDYCKCLTIDEMKEGIKKYNVPVTDEDLKAEGCLHGFLAAYVCRDKYKLSDEIFNAIYYHTCGRPNMTNLEKIIYVSDMIEPLRKFKDRAIELRKLAYVDINKAIVRSCEMSLEYLKKNNLFIHTNTYKTMEYYKNLKG